VEHVLTIACSSQRRADHFDEAGRCNRYRSSTPRNAEYWRSRSYGSWWRLASVHQMEAKVDVVDVNSK
jgi:hypothetical protein